MLQQHNQDLKQARQSYMNALAADPKYLSPYPLLASIYALGQKWQELADLTERALHLDPVDYPQIYLYSAVANYNLGHLEVAAKNAEEGKKLDTQHRYPKLDQVLALVAARKQQEAARRASTTTSSAPAPQ